MLPRLTNKGAALKEDERKGVNKSLGTDDGTCIEHPVDFRSNSKSAPGIFTSSSISSDKVISESDFGTKFNGTGTIELTLPTAQAKWKGTSGFMVEATTSATVFNITGTLNDANGLMNSIVYADGPVLITVDGSGWYAERIEKPHYKLWGSNVKLIRSEQDLIDAIEDDVDEVILDASISVSSDIDGSDWVGNIIRIKPEVRIIDSGGYLTLGANVSIIDLAKPNQLFEISNIGQHRFYHEDVGGTAPAGYIENPSPSGTHTANYTSDYTRPFLSGRFDQDTRKLYMFGGLPDNTSDWKDPWYAAFNSLPPSNGSQDDSFYRKGTIALDRGLYNISSTVYITKGLYIKGPENSGFVSCRLQAASAGFSDDSGCPNANDENASGHWLLSTTHESHSTRSYNSQFETRLSDVNIECNNVAEGMRFSGSEFSSCERVAVTNYTRQGIRFAEGSNNISFRDCAVRNSVGSNGFVAYFFEGLNRHINFINCKTNNADLAVFAQGARPYNISFRNTGFESVTKLLEVGGAEVGTVSFWECTLDTDILDGQYIVDFVGNSEAVFNFTGHLRRSGIDATQEPKIRFRGKEFNLKGEHWRVSSDSPGGNWGVNVKLSQNRFYQDVGIIADGAGAELNMKLTQHGDAVLTLTQNTTLNKPSNARAGDSGTIYVTQSGGSFSITDNDSQTVLLGSFANLSSMTDGQTGLIKYFTPDSTNFFYEIHTP